MRFINFTKLYTILTCGLLALIWSSAALSADETTSQTSEIEGPSIVVLGDSLVAGYQLPAGTGFPDRLQAALTDEGIAAKIIGAGVSGDTSSGGLSRVAWSVPEGTDAVILELGANDALRGLPPETTRKNLDAIIKQLLEREIHVLVVGMLAPPNMGQAYALKFNAIYPELAGEYDLALYPFFLDGVMAQPGMTLPDGMHPNEKGVDEMVKRILPTVIRFIDNMRPSP